MDYEVVRYQPEHMREIAALRQREWGEDPQVSLDYLAWKYEQNPYTNESRFYVALNGGRVVGMRGMYAGLLARGAGDPVLAFAGSDTLVDPEHRGQRLFTQLTRSILDDLEKDGHDFALSLSANRTSQLLSVRSGWVRVATFQPLYYGEPPQHGTDPVSGSRRRPSSRHPSAARRVRSLLGRIAGQGRAPQDAFLHFEERLRQRSEGLSVASEPCPREMAALVRGQDNGNRLQILRDERYYEWRYRNPRSTYRFVFEQGSDGLEGFVVLQQPSRDGDVAVVDWQFADTARGLQLLRAVTEALEARRVTIWSLTLPAGLREGLLAIGFRPQEERDTKAHPARGLMVTSTHAGHTPSEWSFDGVSPLQPENWDLRMIFSDFY